MKTIRILLCSAALAAPLAHAQVKVEDPWVRATVAGQGVTGAFMQITSKEAAKLVGASSPAAGYVEIHEMTMSGNTMKMRAVPSVDLPSGKAVVLGPGGYHVMLFDLKAPLAAGNQVPLKLVFEGKDRKRTEVEVKAFVRDGFKQVPEKSGATQSHKQ